MSKTFTRLVEEVVFESGAKELYNLETVAGLIIEEVLDRHTAQIRYPELYVPDTTLTVTTLATGKIALPTDYQHIDWESFRTLPGGDINYQFGLHKFPAGRLKGVNQGTVRWYNRDASYIYVYPYAELDVTDTFVLSYWRKSNAKTNNLIVPDSLVLTVKDESVGRLALTLGTKTAGNYIQLSRDSHASSLGAVDLPPLQ